MPYKIRVQKKKEEIPLRLIQRSEELVEQVRIHPKWIWSGVGAVIAIIAVFSIVWFLNQQTVRKAGALEAEAFRLFHEPPPLPEPVEEGKKPPADLTDKTERLKKSASLYDEIVEKYPRTDIARTALYESGNVYFELKEDDAAEKRYLSFLEKYSNQGDLAALTHQKLAYLYQRKGNTEAALKQFRAVYETMGALNRDQAGFETARLLESGGKKTEAIDLYKKISADFPKSPWGTEAKGRLTILDPSSLSTPAPGGESLKMAPAPSPGAAPPAESKGK
ncbi:MAG: tetratricopeptide repeat protein [Candidatus Manganitrophaceae bacterium]